MNAAEESVGAVRDPTLSPQHGPLRPTTHTAGPATHPCRALTRSPVAGEGSAPDGPRDPISATSSANSDGWRSIRSHQ
jgi:hypothetical protein